MRDNSERVMNLGSRVSMKKLGLVGFLFFLGKGLLWLLVPAAIALLR